VSPEAAPVLGDTGRDAIQAAASLLSHEECPHCHRPSISPICPCHLSPRIPALPPRGGTP
jgi:hypothetical protein